MSPQPPRAEDVKEALAAEHVYHPTKVEVAGEAWYTIEAAARAYLASQEQTPDYDALIGEVGLRLLRRVNRGETITPERATTEMLNVFDAALVGFHPQPEGGETIWWCVDKQEGHAETMGCYTPRNAPELHQGCGWRMVYGPIPESPEVPT